MSTKPTMNKPGAHLPTAGHFDAIDGSGDLNGADAAVLAALLSDVLQDLLVVLVVHQLLGHHHVEKAQHLRGHARVLQPLEPRDLQHDRGLYDDRLQGHMCQIRCRDLSRMRVNEPHRVGGFSPHAGPLDDQLFITQLHPVESRYRLMGKTLRSEQTGHMVWGQIHRTFSGKFLKTNLSTSTL